MHTRTRTHMHTHARTCTHACTHAHTRQCPVDEDKSVARGRHTLSKVGQVLCLLLVHVRALIDACRNICMRVYCGRKKTISNMNQQESTLLTFTSMQYFQLSFSKFPHRQTKLQFSTQFACFGDQHRLVNVGLCFPHRTLQLAPNLFGNHIHATTPEWQSDQCTVMPLQVRVRVSNANSQARERCGR